MKSSQRLQRAPACELAVQALLIWTVGMVWQSSAKGADGTRAVPVGDRPFSHLRARRTAVFLEPRDGRSTLAIQSLGQTTGAIPPAN